MHSTQAHACGHTHNPGARRYSSGGVKLHDQIVTRAGQMMMELLQKATLCGIKAVVSAAGQGNKSYMNPCYYCTHNAIQKQRMHKCMVHPHMQSGSRFLLHQRFKQPDTLVTDRNTIIPSTGPKCTSGCKGIAINAQFTPRVHRE